LDWDEFSILVALAYDKTATTKAYTADFSLYCSLGASFHRWIMRVAKDEGYHFANVVRLLCRNYPLRQHKINRILQKLVKWDLESGTYRGTFILDHETP
jgi:hypothetical protein